LVRPIDDRWSRRAEAWSLRLALLGVILLALEAGLPELLRVLQEGTGLGSPEELVGGGLGGTAGGILAAVLLQLRARAADAKAAIEGVDRHAGRLARLAPRVRRLVINLAAYVLGPLLIACMFIGALLVQVNDSWSGGFAIVAMLTFAGLYALADLTSWSLHPFYRRRLCTAFALKRVKRLGVDGTELEQDSVGRAVEREQGKFVKLSDTSVVPCWADAEWPTLIVCAAANVSDPGATPPGRSVTSFTFSAEAMGGPLVGGIRTEEFEKRLHERRQRDFNLPAVVAMSGAALSPSMGKLTRPSLRFLMGLAHVRLGVWVPNPRRYDEFVKTPKAARQISPKSGSKTLKRPSVRDLSADERARVRETAERRRVQPRPRPIYLLKELLGKTSVNDPYLYITDGGHYENLGLVELLRRGCTRIYCFDASGGRELNELGDAIALARTELGVELEFERSELDLIKEGEVGFAERACARGTIRYTRGKQAVGTIVYARTVMAREVPLDLHSFKARDDVFPHHSTVDQLFTDQKFEAYRVLGQHAAAAAIEAMESSRTEEPAPKAPAPAPVHPVELGRRVLEATRRRAVPR
ncbi:MAG TPA: hypothetical protein VEQ61_07445, partial [Thermoleophilaceae bacterium]|nr:hypothetical protein [Thermoleophilaceae bacterium]